MPGVPNEALLKVDHHHEELGLCKKVPSLFSSFVDAFVDYAVGGQVLAKPPAPPPSDSDDGVKLEDRTWLPPAERIIAIGDVHGDLAKARAALQVAQVMDENDHWIGGETVVVQVLFSHVYCCCGSL